MARALFAGELAAGWGGTGLPSLFSTGGTSRCACCNCTPCGEPGPHPTTTTTPAAQLDGPPPPPRRGHAAAAVGRWVVFMGGLTEQKSMLGIKSRNEYLAGGRVSQVVILA